MKKFSKVFVATVALTVACASQVFATEPTLNAEINALKAGNDSLSNAVTTLVSFDNGCNPADIMSMHAIVNTAMSNYDKNVLSEKQNFINYLNQVVVNKKEIERVKKANIAAITDLVKVNPSFKTQLDAAVIEYNQAVADRIAAENDIEIAKNEFAALQAGINANREAKSVGDADVIK